MGSAGTVGRELAQYAAQSSALIAGLHPRQQQWVRDRSKLKAALCGRRAGKSYCIAVWLLLGALAVAGSRSLYIATTRGHAKRVLWSVLKRIARERGLGAKAHETDLVLELPNASQIWVTGCPDDAHAEVYRGDAYARVAIDEAASFPDWLTYLIEDIIGPALLDHDGDLAMVGSPGVAPVGAFFDATGTTRKGGWSVHEWTVLDNPAIPNARQWLDDKLRVKGWTWDHTTVRREWLGQWILDDSMLVYRWSPSVEVDSLPAGIEWSYVLGVDLGASQIDPTTAFTIVAFSRHHSKAFVVRSWAVAGATPTTIAQVIQGVLRDWPIESVVVDAGGLGGGYVSELRTRWSIPVDPAEKQLKRGAIEMMNNDLIGGNLCVVRAGCAGLLAEWRSLPWTDEHRLVEAKEHPNHHADSALYAWRRTRAYVGHERDAGPARGSPDWQEAQMIAALESAEARRARNSMKLRRMRHG